LPRAIPTGAAVEARIPMSMLGDHTKLYLWITDESGFTWVRSLVDRSYVDISVAIAQMS